MLRSILFDLAFLGFASALLLSTINIQGALVSLIIGVLAALTDSAITDAPRARSRNTGAKLVPVGLRTEAKHMKRYCFAGHAWSRADVATLRLAPKRSRSIRAARVHN
jgi:hypothetical protein